MLSGRVDDTRHLLAARPTRWLLLCGAVAAGLGLAFATYHLSAKFGGSRASSRNSPGTQGAWPAGNGAARPSANGPLRPGGGLTCDGSRTSQYRSATAPVQA